MPWPLQSPGSPPSALSQTPPHDTPIRTVSGERGSTSTERKPEYAAPRPTQDLRYRSFHRTSTSRQVPPPSREWNRPPGIVPHQSSPSRCDASSDQTFMTFHGMGVLRIGSRSTTSSGLGG